MPQTPQAISAMRELWPMMVNLLKTPGMQQQLLIEQKVVNWDAINEVERECGLPITPCPDSPILKYLGLEKKDG